MHSFIRSVFRNSVLFRYGKNVTSPRRYVVLLVVSMLLVPAPGLVLAGGDGGDGPEDPPVGPMAYTSHSPFIINSDSEMSVMASAKGWSGSGTAGDPYIITGYEINGSGINYCIGVGNVSVHFEITDNLLYGAEREDSLDIWNGAIAVTNCSNATVSWNSISSPGWIGCYLTLSTATAHNNTLVGVQAAFAIGMADATIFDNVIDAPIGILALLSPKITIGWNTMNSSDMTGVGIHVEDIADVTIEGNEIAGYAYGIEGYDIPGIKVIGNTLEETWMGIDLDGCDDAEIGYNTITSEAHTVRLDSCHRATMDHNSLYQGGIHFQGYSATTSHWSSHDIDTTNTFHGRPVGYIVNETGKDLPAGRGLLLLVGCTSMSMEGETLPSQYGGIHMAFCDGVIIANSILHNEFNTSISWYKSDNVSVVGNDLVRVYLSSGYDSDQSAIEDNIMDEGGLTSYRGDGNSIQGNTLKTSAEDGFYISSCQDLVVKNNTIEMVNTTYNSDAIAVFECRDAVFRDNRLKGANLYIFGREIEEFDTVDIDMSNTVEGLPILYIVNESVQIESGAWGQIILAFCTDFTVRGLTLTNRTSMIQAIQCKRGEITRNVLSNQMSVAILVMYGEDIQVTKNLISDTYVGIDVLGSYGISVSGNYVSGSDRGIISFSSENVTIERNLIEDCRIGADIFAAAREYRISYNIIENSSGLGLWVDGRDIGAHHNMFVDNNRSSESGLIEGPQCFGEGYVCTWDDGTQGNYWSDYTDKHPTAGNDGTTWDVPYVVGGGDGYQDDHPLVDPFDPVPPLAFANGYNMSIDPGDTVDFSAWGSVDNVGIVSIVWSLVDDGNDVVLPGMNVSYTFHRTGLYWVTLNVTDPAGNSDIVLIRVAVGNVDPPKADAGEDITVDQGDVVTFDASGSVADRRYAVFSWVFTYDGEPVELDGSTSPGSTRSSSW
jgi:parallel beta-helix repeat protein